MKYLFLGLSSFLAIVAQMIVGKEFFLFNFLDLSLLLIAYWAFYRSRTEALFVGSLTGILMDAALGWPLGYNGFGKTIAAFVIGQSSRKFNVAESWVQFSITVASSCLSSLSIYILSWLLERSTSRIFLGASLVQAIILFACLDSYKRAQMNKVR
jgi:rod shape-determining protein MreD